MNKSAVIMPKWIGDYVMALAAVEQFRNESDKECAVLTAPYLVDLAKKLTTMEVIPYKTDDGLERCKSGDFSDLYILPHSISTALWGFSTGIKNRIGYRNEGRSPLLTVRKKRPNSSRKLHITMEYTNLFGIDDLLVDRVPGVDLTATVSDAIVLCPGAKYGPAKQWPHYSYLIESLPSEKFIILGGPDESEYAEMLIRENQSVSVTNLCGKGSLVDAAQHLAEAKVIVSNDSGLMHLAAYVGANVIGIFGSSTPTWTRPLGSKSVALWKNEKCSPCFKRECPYGHYFCLDTISVTEVVSHLKSYI